jgi:hypothetical protein
MISLMACKPFLKPEVKVPASAGLITIEALN